MLDALASIAPSCMFFAIGEQLNALTGLLLCLYMTWHHMENPKRDGLILMISGVIVFFLCGIACCLAHVPSLWSVIPSAPVVVLALRKMTNLPWGQLLFVVSTAAYIVAIVYYLSLAVDLAVLNEQSMNLRVGWPGMISLLIFDLIAATTLFHPFHHSFSATFDSPSISRNFWRVIWLFPFISTAIVVWCMPADNASLLDTRVLSIAFTVSIAYSGFMTMAYFLIWYMVQQADRLREASKREHYEAMPDLAAAAYERTHQRSEADQAQYPASYSDVAGSRRGRRYARASPRIWRRWPIIGCCSPSPCSIANMLR